MTVSCRVLTPPAGRGAVAVIGLEADTAAAMDTLLGATLDEAVPIGGVRLRTLCGVDRGLVARWSGVRVDLMPHGGPAVVRAVLERLAAEGGVPGDLRPEATYPEATSPEAAGTLEALASAASPLAVDVLLSRGLATPPERLARLAADPVAVRRLVDPPLVAAVGPPSVGKSTLLNALVGRTAALVDDAPGTTRDHVGLSVDLAGLVVRYLDTPGLPGGGEDDADDLERNARDLALGAVRAADLVLLCGDAALPPLDPDRLGLPPTRLRVALREDLGRASWAFDVSLTARDAAGVRRLAVVMRDRLLGM